MVTRGLCRSRDLQLTTPASSRSSRSGMGIPGPGRGHWELDADRITIDRHPDGSLWKLGSGEPGSGLHGLRGFVIWRASVQ